MKRRRIVLPPLLSLCASPRRRTKRKVEYLWVQQIQTFATALPTCSDANLKLISPRGPTKRLMRGSWFTTKQYKVKETALDKLCVFTGKKKTPRRSVVALDPGTAIFQTSYGTDGIVSMWGCGNITHLVDIREKKQTQHFDDILKELHKKLIKWLLTTYDLIIVADFNTPSLWQHQKFIETLLRKAPGHGKEVFVVEESYTSQICSSCGRRNKQAKKRASFACKDDRCNLQSHRDVNAAKNILMKFLVESTKF